MTGLLSDATCEAPLLIFTFDCLENTAVPPLAPNADQSAAPMKLLRSARHLGSGRRQKIGSVRQ